MAEPVGTIIEVTHRCSMFNQRILNVLHYVVQTQSSTVSYTDEMEQLSGFFADQGVNGIMTAFQAVTPSSLDITGIVAQSVYPQRKRRVVTPLTLNGTGGVGSIQNIQGSITFWNILAGRPFIGGKRVVVPSSLVANGLLANTLKTDLDVLGDRWTQTISEPVGGGVYGPVIFHRSTVMGSRYHPINGYFVQDTARVMRRRTVGVGE